MLAGQSPTLILSASLERDSPGAGLSSPWPFLGRDAVRRKAPHCLRMRMAGLLRELGRAERLPQTQKVVLCGSADLVRGPFRPRTAAVAAPTASSPHHRPGPGLGLAARVIGDRGSRPMRRFPLLAHVVGLVGAIAVVRIRLGVAGRSTKPELGLELRKRFMLFIERTSSCICDATRACSSAAVFATLTSSRIVVN